MEVTQLLIKGNRRTHQLVSKTGSYSILVEMKVYLIKIMTVLNMKILNSKMKKNKITNIK